MPDIRKIDFNLLRALHVLIEERNVSRTAQRLSLTQPTVSGMLNRLRDLFADPLFVRTQHGVLPTPRAEALAPGLARLLADAEALVAPQAFDPSMARMDVSISVNDYMQSALVSPFFRTLRREAPGIRLAIRHLEIADLTHMLARAEIDLAITIPQFTDDTLHSQFLYREEYVGVVREQHPIRSKRLTMEQFLACDQVMVSPSEGSFEGPTDVELAGMGKQRKVVLSLPSFLVLADVLERDDLLALVPKRLVTGRLAGLRQIKVPVSVPGFDVISAWHSRTHYEPAHRWIRDRLAQLAHGSQTVDQTV
jgi:DNA-binding transcriptional LysR family regulator